MYYSRIKLFAENRNIAIKELALKADLTEAGLHQMIRKESIKVDVLERIAKLLNVPIQSFFEENIDLKTLKSPNIKVIENPSTCRNCEQLQKLVDSQARHIERLEIDLEQCRKFEKRKAG